MNMFCEVCGYSGDISHTMCGRGRGFLIGIKNKLLEEARSAPVRLVQQFDGFAEADRDGCPLVFDHEFSPDHEGDSVAWATSWGLQRSNAAVRVRVLENVDRVAAARMLRKIADIVENGTSELTPPFAEGR